MTRGLSVLSADGHTGLTLLQLLDSNERFRSAYSTVHALTYSDHYDEELKALKKLNKLSVIDVSRKSHLKGALKGVQTLVVIPPARADKHKRVRDVLEEAKNHKGLSMVLLSTAGAEFATKEDQPHLHEFIELETLAMAQGESCIVRAGFYAENLLDYFHKAKDKAGLPLPIDKEHKFAPVSLGDVALLLAEVIVSKGPHGLGDKFRGQLITLTGPMLVTGDELAHAASQTLDSKMKFKSIAEDEALDILDDIPDSNLDQSEKQVLLEYYSLVKQGKTNYVSTMGFEQATGQALQSPQEFFAAYKSEFKPKKRRTAK